MKRKLFCFLSTDVFFWAKLLMSNFAAQREITRAQREITRARSQVYTSIQPAVECVSALLWALRKRFVKLFCPPTPRGRSTKRGRASSTPPFFYTWSV